VKVLPHFARGGSEARARLEEEARAALAGIEGDDVEGRPVVARSAARGLFELAEAEGADLLVVGSSHRAGLGAVLAGSVGRALLQGAPCAVAVAPRGYRHTATDALRVIGVGYDATPESDVALAAATETAVAAGATMRVIMVVPPAIGDEASSSSRQVPREPSFHDRMRERLNAAVERCPREVRALGQLIAGNPAPTLRDEAEKGVDVLFVGSRGYGPLLRVTLGSIADELLRLAPCPVVVFPRGGRTVAPAAS
jgi:nucleotide-binding universal stress UspA family protein